MKQLYIKCLITFFFALSFIRGTDNYIIKHLEPPSWWTGMNNDTLQVMVHGENISDLEPSISHPGVTIVRSHHLESANYLFIDLKISSDAEPGAVDISFINGAQKVITHSYQLKKRRPDSANRQGFNASDVIYLITPDRYVNGDPNNDTVEGLKEPLNRKNKDGRHGGDLKGIIDNLDYLVDMGFTQIWLNPILENNQGKYSYHGYSTTDYYTIDPRFGSNELYKELSFQAKQNGIGIIKDIILNHIGSEHWWMNDLPTFDWINNNGEFSQTSHIHESVYDPHLPESEKIKFVDGWFVRSMPDLNQNNLFLSTYIIQNSIWWIEYADLSGFRVDTYPYVDKDFLSKWSKRISKEYPLFNFVGEEWTSNSAMIAYWQKGSARNDNYQSFIPSMMDFPLQEALIKSLLANETWDTGIRDLYKVVANDFLYADPYELVVFAGNHDMSRIYNQLGKNINLYKMAMTFILTTRGIPQVYYGTEILMEGPKDHGSLRADFPGGWPNDKKNAFTGRGLSKSQKEIQSLLRKILNWRKTSSAITTGDLIHYVPEDGIYIYFRRHQEDLVMVVINNNDRLKKVNPVNFKEILSGRSKAINILDDKEYDLKKTIHIAKKSVLVLDFR